MKRFIEGEERGVPAAAGLTPRGRSQVRSRTFGGLTIRQTAAAGALRNLEYVIDFAKFYGEIASSSFNLRIASSWRGSMRSASSAPRHVARVGDLRIRNPSYESVKPAILAIDPAQPRAASTTSNATAQLTGSLLP